MPSMMVRSRGLVSIALSKRRMKYPICVFSWWVRQHTVTASLLLFVVEQSLGYEPRLADNLDVIRVTICAVVASIEEDASQIRALGDDET